MLGLKRKQSFRTTDFIILKSMLIKLGMCKQPGKKQALTSTGSFVLMFLSECIATTQLFHLYENQLPATFSFP